MIYINGHIDTVRYLIDLGADIRRINIIESAIAMAMVETISLLAERGADLSCSKYLEIASVVLRKYDLCQFLISQGTRVNFSHVLTAARTKQFDTLKLVTIHCPHVMPAVVTDPKMFLDLITIGYWRPEFAQSEILSQHRYFILSQFASIVGSENSELVANVVSSCV